MFPAHHLDLALQCEAVYDCRGPDLWSVAENDVLVVELEDRVRLACCGTQARDSVFNGNFTWEGLSNARDIAKDLRFWPYKVLPGVWVHKGFGRAALVWAEHFALELVKFGKPFEITGHSLGGGMAPILAMVLKSMGFDVLEVVTFGEPAGFYFGSEKKYQPLNIPTTSYLHANDWIQKAPPWGSTAVERTRINPEPGISRKAHDIGEYVAAMG